MALNSVDASSDLANQRSETLLRPLTLIFSLDTQPATTNNNCLYSRTEDKGRYIWHAVIFLYQLIMSLSLSSISDQA